MCTWLGPSAERPGVFGTDLGFEVAAPNQNGAPSDQLQLLFGDTWVEATDACSYPVLQQDDLATTIPRRKPDSLLPGPPAAMSDACDSIRYPLSNPADPTSWRRIRLFPDAGERSPERALDTGMNRTPLTAWSDGAHTFTLFIRDQYAHCATNAQCPGGMTCTRDPSYRGKRIGGCQPQISITSDPAPLFCRDDGDCTAPAVCADLDGGACVANEPFALERDGQRLSPTWYVDDPRDGLATVLHVASAFWPDRPEDFATGFRFITNKFINATARTVAHFDPQHPENNDYSPGNETLLVWGRPAFVGHDGYQALPFLLYQPLAGLLDASGQIAWAPRYFAGYDAEGNPAWSESEAAAQPIYGVEENLVQHGGQWSWNWRSPEFDYVNQTSMTWVAPLQRWIMLYGGESPGEIDPSTGRRPIPGHPQSISGAVYLRSAAHPWGRARANAHALEAYGTARPVLTPAAVAHELACGDDAKNAVACNPELPTKGADLLDSLGSAVSDFSVEDIAAASAKCLAGNVAMDTQLSGDDSRGHMYGAAIIEPWTEDVTGALPDLAQGDRAVELYWNISTWNPYQVLLIKTQLRASELGAR